MNCWLQLLISLYKEQEKQQHSRTRASKWELREVADISVFLSWQTSGRLLSNIVIMRRCLKLQEIGTRHGCLTLVPTLFRPNRPFALAFAKRLTASSLPSWWSSCAIYLKNTLVCKGAFFILSRTWLRNTVVMLRTTPTRTDRRELSNAQWSGSFSWRKVIVCLKK